MTYRYTDPDGDPITVNAADVAGPVIFLKTTENGCYIPLARVEELVAGIRDTARQAAQPTAQPGTETRFVCKCPQGCCGHDQPDTATDAQPKADTCTCAAAGACFAPAGHYADCPAAP
jgi:hypothetical protein